MISAAAGDHRGLRQRPGDVPDPLGEQLDRPVVRLRLHVLREADGDRTGLGRVGEHAHRARSGRRAAARAARSGRSTCDTGRNASLTVTSPAYGSSSSCSSGEAAPVGEGVGRQQQHRQPVDGGQRGAGDHVGRAGTDASWTRRTSAAGSASGRTRRRCAPWPARCGPARTAARPAHRARPAAAPGRAGHVAVAEDAEAAREELLLDPVGLGVLRAEELHGRLGDGQPYGLGA